MANLAQSEGALRSYCCSARIHVEKEASQYDETFLLPINKVAKVHVPVPRIILKGLEVLSGVLCNLACLWVVPGEPPWISDAGMSNCVIMQNQKKKDKE